MNSFEGIPRLQQVFAVDKMILNVRSDHIVAEKSQKFTRNKIRTIVESAGFCPIVSYNKIDNNIAFTVVPFKMPDWFRANPQDGQADIFPQRALSDQSNAQPRNIAQFEQNNIPNNNVPDNILVQKPLPRRVNLFYKTANENLVGIASENSKDYNDHFEHNKRNILSLAKNLQGEALILGLGNGDDLPLPELAYQFKQITALDIDVKAMHKAIQKLPAPLRNRFVLVQKDVTGVLSMISEKMQSLLANLIPEKECLEMTADIMDESILEYDRTFLSSKKKYDFVISSMLTSQLFSQIIPSIMNVLEQKYPGIQQRQHSCQKLQDSYQNFGNNVCRMHFNHLLDWTHTESKIYYADNTHRTYVHLDAVEHMKNPSKPTYKLDEPRETLPIETINKAIKTNFLSLKDEDSWIWRCRPPLVIFKPYLHSQSGIMMRVVAHFLQPKALFKEKEVREPVESKN